MYGSILLQGMLYTECHSVLNSMYMLYMHSGQFFILFCRLQTFPKLTFSKKSFRNTTRVSNSLDPDQDRLSVGPDLGPNCLQRLSGNDKTIQIKHEAIPYLCVDP